MGKAASAADAPETPPTLTIDAGGHTAVISSLLTLPDGQLLSSSYDNTIRLWDVRAEKTLRIIRGQVGGGRRGQVVCMTLTPDDRLLLVGGWFDDEERGRHPIRIYDWPKGTLRGLLDGHDRPLRSLAISPDGQFMASGDFGGTLRYWRRTPDGFEPLVFVQAHTDRVSNLVFDPTGGKLLVSTGYDGIARFWSYGPTGIKETSALRPLSLPTIYGCVWRPDGAVIAFAGATTLLNPQGNDGEVRFYTRDGKPTGQPIVQKDTGITAIDYSPDGRRMVVGCGYPGTDTRAWVYSVPDNKIVAEFGGHDNTINDVKFLGDGRTVASVGSYNNAVLRWDTATGKQLGQLGGRSSFMWNAGVSRDGTTLYWGTGLYDPKGVFNLDKANERGPLEWGLSLADKQPELVSAAGADAIRGSSTLGKLQLERFQDERLQFVQLLEGGAKLTSGRDRDVIYGATFLPSAKLARLGAQTPVLVAGGESLGLFDAKSGRRIHELFGHVGQVLAVAPSPLGDFAVSAGGDQTLRLWHLPSGKLRLSVFHAGDDWIAWTPQGFYAASPQGDRLIGWQINRGEGRDPEHYAAVQFSKLLFRPEVIPQALNSEAAPDVGAGVDKISEIVPPEVEILGPRAASAGPLKLTATKLELTAVAKSQGKFPVTEVRLLLNGRPYEGKAGLQRIAKPRLGAVSASWSVELEPGEHRLAVQAKTDVSTAVSEALPVSLVSENSSGLKGPDGKPLDLPNMYVLAVGVSSYAGDLALNYAAKDAEAIETVLRENGGALREVKTKLLTNEQATRKNIMEGLSWLKREMTQRDVGVIFFSGHGMKDENNNFYLCPVDVDADSLFSTGVPGNQLRDFLSGVPGKVIAILDACHAGSLAEEKRKSGGVLTDDLVHELINEDCGVVVMCSSQGREVSLESPTHRQGYFTVALVSGLSGEADYNQDAIVDLKELDLYVTHQVKKLTDGRQHAVTKNPAEILPPPLTMLSNKTANRRFEPLRLAASGP
jgi:WD40 repeat protein